MAQSLGEFLNLMQRECGDHPPDALLAQQWLQYRYGAILERAAWSWLIKETTFQTVAAITAGTVTVTLGSTTVTETTSNANGWSSSVETRYFRKSGDDEFYLINTFADANPDTLTLARAYEGDTGTVKQYKIFQRIYALASDVREILDMQVLDTPGPMIRVSQQEIGDTFSNRSQVGSPPNYWAYAGRNSSDVPQIEVYPIPDEAHGILYHYLPTTTSLVAANTSIIPQVGYGLLRAGWLADYWSWRAAFDNAPNGALVTAQAYSAEFEKRLQEMIIREAPNMAHQKMGLPARFTKHRLQSKWGSKTEPIELP